ncbi:unnamed protein product [Lactuca virosa]|uniref:ER membrane protein complex subunit 2 n=1 Tax=Lactuca virosa TaxID=75947 RepID=A0AAU9LH08_9ASTR|nr:unnamed protein product [Lactuca virosa]
MGMHSQNYHLIVLGALGVVLVVISMRRVGMAKARGDILAAIDWLNKYLEIFMADHDAWRELAKVYVSLYKQAGFCYEELILSPPIIPIHHLAYADKTRFPKRSSKSECSRNK